jgi:hypothetical protein
MSYLCFTRFHLYPALRLPSSPDVEPDGEEAPFWAEEICKTFAGLEDGLGENDACMLPCASALLQAALCVPANQNSRFWIRYKLGHLERAGLIAVRKVKEALAGLWNMPDIVTDGFYPMASPPHILKLRDLDEDDLLKEMEGVALKGKGVDSRPGSRDGQLQGLKEMRGLFELRR